MRAAAVARRHLHWVLLAAHAGLLAWGGYIHSPTFDETGYLPSGIYHWKYGRFALANVNPPLVRLVAALPVMAVGAAFDWRRAGGDESNFFSLGQAFIAANGERAMWLYTLGRWACIPFSLVGGWVAWRWASELYGARAGLLALVLWCVCPNILGHGQLLTPDVAAASLGLAAAWRFWHWQRSESWDEALLAGLVLGLAELARPTWLVLFVLWPAIWLLRVVVRWVGREGRRGGEPIRAGAASTWRSAAQLATMVFVAVVVLNLGYGFEGTGTQLGDFAFGSRVLAGQDDRGSGNRFRGTVWEHVPVPLPTEYVLGLDRSRAYLEFGMRSYLRGVWKQRGWWYYYLYGLAIKVPLGTWLLGVAGSVAWLLALRRGGQQGTASALQPSAAARPGTPQPGWLEASVLLLPPAALLILVSSQTGYNHHVRYAMPVLGFGFVWAARIAQELPVGFPGGPRWTRYVRGTLVCLLAAWAAASSLWHYPHSMSYFNELVGGPAHGARHLLDSNIDWGQDLLLLRRWLRDHPEARPLRLAYFGNFDPRVVGIEFTNPPFATGLEPGYRPPPGWYAVSVNFIHGYAHFMADGQGGWTYVPSGGYVYFQQLQPVARCGWSIYVYRVEELREQAGQTHHAG
jgi:hypothetical protein